ncbi:hypothetical protein [Streptomyces sp. NPDC020747]|uniref:hypothetical protein n=1 Tax=Streptomyces sp. NPDC020747 TaxID=3365086 RepID=UPI0037A0D9EA
MVHGGLNLVTHAAQPRSVQVAKLSDELTQIVASIFVLLSGRTDVTVRHYETVLLLVNQTLKGGGSVPHGRPKLWNESVTYRVGVASPFRWPRHAYKESDYRRNGGDSRKPPADVILYTLP